MKEDISILSPFVLLMLNKKNKKLISVSGDLYVNRTGPSMGKKVIIFPLETQKGLNGTEIKIKCFCKCT